MKIVQPKRFPDKSGGLDLIFSIEFPRVEGMVRDDTDSARHGWTMDETMSAVSWCDNNKTRRHMASVRAMRMRERMPIDRHGIGRWAIVNSR